MKICSKWLLSAAVGFTLFILGIVVLADENHLPWFIDAIWDLPFGDKAGHFLLMGFWAFLVNLAWRGARFRVGPFRILKGSFLVVILVTLEECSQVYFPSRSFSLWDLAADYAGIFLFSRAALMVLRRFVDGECRKPMKSSQRIS